MSADIKSAYRTCPVLPAHKPWLGVSLRDPRTGVQGFFLDHCVPFGLGSAHGCLGMVVDAAMDIWEAVSRRGLRAKKWVDDVVAAQVPRTDEAPLTKAGALGLLAPLRIPWHPDKGQEFADEVDYLGFHWSLADKTVALPDSKRVKFKGRTDMLLLRGSGGSVTAHDAQVLMGSLNHITFVIPEGRSYLPGLSAFFAGFGPITPAQQRLRSRHPPPSLLADMRWWSSTLSRSVPPRHLALVRAPLDLGISVDASTDWGIGLVWRDNLWDAWRTRAGWRGPGRHIGWLECVAVEFIARALDRLDVRDSHVLVRSDNMGVIGSFDKGRSRSFEMNLSVRRSLAIASARNITFDLRYVESANNPADPISRGELGPVALRFASDFELPEELQPYLARHA
jgi:hypothetical protein